MIYGISSRDKRKELNPGFWKDFAGRDTLLNHQGNVMDEPAVNIIENSNDYILEIATPGLCKKDFHLEVDNNVLKIKGEKTTDTSKKYTRKDFQYSQFEKAFALPDEANQEEIAASCNDGILTIDIPKKKEVEGSNLRNIEVM